jgi:hypothetical protein
MRNKAKRDKSRLLAEFVAEVGCNGLGRWGCEPSQVLSDGGQNKLILGASWATQS